MTPVPICRPDGNCVCCDDCAPGWRKCRRKKRKSFRLDREIRDALAAVVLLGGAGGLEAGITVLAIRDQVAPPTINYEFPDPECDLDYIPNEARLKKVEHVLSNSFGFGGQNASLIMTRVG